MRFVSSILIGQIAILLQARPFFKDSDKNFDAIVDPDLQDVYDYYLQEVLKLSAGCLEQDAVDRPPVKDVVSVLHLLLLTTLHCS